MPAILDHVYAIVAGPAAAEPLQEAGLTIDGGRRHAGQGTANRRILFGDSFIELLFIVDEAEAAQNMLRLHERRCPIGIGLRGGALPGPSAVYAPPYGAGQFDFLVSTAQDAPMLFAMRPAFTPPRSWAPALVRQHACGAVGIARLELAGPGATRGPLVAPWLACREADGWELTVVLAGAPGLHVIASPHLRVVGEA